MIFDFTRCRILYILIQWLHNYDKQRHRSTITGLTHDEKIDTDVQSIWLGSIFVSSELYCRGWPVNKYQVSQRSSTDIGGILFGSIFVSSELYCRGIGNACIDGRANRIVYVFNEPQILTWVMLLSCECIQAKVSVIVELHNEFTNYYSSTYTQSLLLWMPMVTMCQNGEMDRYWLHCMYSHSMHSPPAR